MLRPELQPTQPTPRSSMKYKFAALAAAFAGMTLLGAAPAYADEEEDARARADVRSQIGETDPDYGPSFNWRGKLFPNKKAFIDSGARCSTRHVTDFEQYLHDLSHETWKLERASQGRSVAERAPGTVQIPVVVHVISKGTGIANGDVPQSQIDAQMTVLNAAYAATGSPFFFTLPSVTRTTNADLVHHDAGLAGRDRMPRTRCASAARGTLNLYIGEPGGRTCSAGRPSRASYARNPKRDGVVILYSLAARRQRRALQPGRHRDPRGRPLDGPVPHVPGRLHADGRPGRATPRPSESPAFGCPVGRDTLRRASRASTRSRTSWTTPTTPA